MMGAVVQKPLTVLLVDDEALVRQSLDAGLRLNGYEVLHAGDGDEALDVSPRRPLTWS